MIFLVLAMSEAKKRATRFEPDELGFPKKLKTKAQHLDYLHKNRLKHYLNKVDYPERAGLSNIDSMLRDFWWRYPSTAFYNINHKPEFFVAAVRGFIYYRELGKKVGLGEATAKGMSFK